MLGMVATVAGNSAIKIETAVIVDKNRLEDEGQELQQLLQEFRENITFHLIPPSLNLN